MAESLRLRAFYAFSFLKNLQFFGALAVPFYLYRVNLDYGRMFVLEALFSVSMMLLEVPTGVVADKWGRKISLMLGTSFLALGFLAFGIFRSFWVLAAAEVVCALGMTFVSGADKAFLYEYLAAHEMESRDAGIAGGGDDGAGYECATRTEASQTNSAKNGARRAPDVSAVFGRYEAAGTAGLCLAFPLGSLFAGSGIVPYTSALGLVFVFTALALGFSGLALVGVKETRISAVHGGYLKHGIDGFLLIFRKRELRAFGIDYAVISAFTFFMFWFYQSLLGREGVPVSWNGFVGAGFNLGAALMLSATGAIQRKFGARRTLFLSSFLPGILYIAAGAVHGLAVALIAMSGVVMLRLFRAPMLSAAMNTLIGDDHRATVLSGISMLERILIAALYPVVGVMADRSLDMTLIGLGVLTVLASFVVRWASRPTGRGWL